MAKFRRNQNDTYGLTSPLVDSFPPPIIAQRVPATTDTGHRLGQVWVNTVTAQAWTMTQTAAGLATWSLSSPGASDVDTINGLGPVAGNIIVDGGTNVTDVNGGNTVTLNLDAAITLATSVTSPLFTAAAADALIQAGGVNDVVVRLGDNAGATFFRVQDSDSADVYTVDSDGATTFFAGLVVTGAFTQTAGIANIGADAAANAVNIGTGAAAKVVTIGSVNGASSLDLLAGTGNFTLEGNVATTYAISNVGVNTGQVDIAGGTGARTINIGGGGTGAKTINIGAAASADVITIGDATGAGSLDLVAGTGNFTLEGNVATTYAISGAGVNTGLITIGGGTGAQTLEMMNVAGVKTVNLANGVDGNTVSVLNGVNTGAQILNLASGANAANSTVNVLGGIATAGVQTLNLATGASASLVNIGNAIGATAIAAVSGTGGTLVDSTGVIELNSSAAAISIGDDADAFAINVGTGAAQRDITIGNITGTTGIILNSGTGGVQVNTTGAGDYILTSADTVIIDAAGVVELNSTAGVIGIGNDADANNINIGTGAAAREVTIGNNTGASGVTVTSGTGNINLNGTCENVLSKFVTRTGDDITFTQSPLTCTAANTGGVATGATSDLNLLTFQEGMIMEQFILGAGQTIIKPVMTATGLLVSGDETNIEGFEINFGAARANSRHSFTIGTSPAFFMEMSFRADDISGLEPCYMGFRRTQANQIIGQIALYTDFVAYGLNDGIAPGDAVISTQLNTGGLVNTDTNDAWADTATHLLRINVSAAGVCTFEFDGGAPTVTQAVTFDNGDVVHPFWRSEFNAALPDAIEWISMECGFQA